MNLTGDPLIIGLQITITGVTVVFTALIVVALALGGLRSIERALIRRRATDRATAPPTIVRRGAEVPPEQLTPALVAVLAATAAEMFDQPVRVTRVRYYDQQPAGVWSRQGRIAIMASRQNRQ